MLGIGRLRQEWLKIKNIRTRSAFESSKVLGSYYIISIFIGGLVEVPDFHRNSIRLE
jgi:hypothetical protein